MKVVFQIGLGREDFPENELNHLYHSLQAFCDDLEEPFRTYARREMYVNGIAYHPFKKIEEQPK